MSLYWQCALLLAIGAGLGWSARSWAPTPAPPTALVSVVPTKAEANSTAPATKPDRPNPTPIRVPGNLAPRPTATIQPATADVATQLNEILRKLETGEETYGAQIDLRMDLIDNAGEAGDRLWGEFLRRNIDMPMKPGKNEEDPWNSLRFHAVRRLALDRTAESEAALVYVVQTSPILAETMEAALALQQWGVTEGSVEAGQGLREMSAAALNNLPKDEEARGQILGIVMLTVARFDGESLLPRLWAEIKRHPPEERSAISQMFPALPGATQEKLLREALDDPGVLKSLTLGSNVDLWDFQGDASVEAAARLFTQPEQSWTRLNFLKSSYWTRTTYMKVSAFRVERYGSTDQLGRAKDPERLRTKLAGVEKLMQRLSREDLTPAERLLVNQRLAELAAAREQAH